MSVPQSKQEWLDLMIKTSLEGGFPSVERSGQCAYRGPDGRKCVVGLLIPDEEYNEDLEGPIGSDIVRTLPDWARDRSVMRRVQSCHDRQTKHEAWAGPWNHDKFIEDLIATEVFSDCKFPETVQA